MKTVTVWMEYVSKSSIEVEVDDDFDVYANQGIDNWPDEWLSELDDGIVEHVPQDWGIKE